MLYKYEGEITDKVIAEFISMHIKDNKQRYKKLQDYYVGKNSILQRVMIQGNNINNKVSNNYAGYITDMATGYFLGRPVNYTDIGKNNFLSVIQDIYNYNDEQDENVELSKQASIKGKSFEVIYLDLNDLDENNLPKLRFNKVESENMFCVYDYGLSPEIYFAVRFYDISMNKKTVTKIEVYTKDEIIFYEKNGSKLTETQRTPHFFKIVPVIEFQNNEECIGDFEKVISQIDAYDKAESDSINNLDYFADSYLYLVGMKETDMSQIDEMKQKRVLLLDEKGEAGFLTKEDNSTETENIANRLKSDIHKFSLVPDLSDEHFVNNASGIAIAYKLLGLEQLAVKKERKFKRGLQRRLEIITNYLNFRGNNFDYRDIQIRFTRNIPVNDKENVEIVQMLKNLISTKTALSNLKMIDDVNAELENIAEEKEAYSDMLGRIDLSESDNIGDGNES
ncbi:phage portal protein [Criibacterium bergeronii]|uniref:Phage portal protein n=1 Tax=Criibacterium bergeronii TaxID=1871336 RepID=A0A552V6Y3_9FIRM|nr:phage portal protein [Criibacterium bergeronii]TRW26237.1 phage portal protein [Criibacterium bergeronii]